MANEDAVLRLKFAASKPEISEIEKDIEFAIEGRPLAEVGVALVRVLADLVLLMPPEDRTEARRRIAVMLAACVCGVDQ